MRFSVAVLYCLFSLAAVNFKLCEAAGLPTKKAASVAVEADGSILVRQHEVDLDQIRMALASKDDGERHHTDGRAVDSIPGADSTETSESEPPMRQKMLHPDELANGVLVADGSVGVSEHAYLDPSLPSMRGPWEEWGGEIGLSPFWSLVFFICLLICLIVCLLSCFCHVCCRIHDPSR